MRLSWTSLIELHFGEYTATVAPAAGGRVASLSWNRGGENCPLLVECCGDSFDAHDWPKAGAFPMLPFANRLPPEGVTVGATMIRPEPGPAGFAVHGFAHRHAWDVVLVSAERVVMTYTHDGMNSGWPWAWSATEEVQLGERGLTVNIRVCNDSCEPMPLAMGWHPYHPVPADITPSDLLFQSRARHELDAQGAAHVAEGDPTFKMRRGETAAFAGWTGRARLRTIRGTIEIGGEGVTNLVVHRAVAGDYLCVEPVTTLPGRLGHATPLDPGESRRLAWSCRFEPSSS